jgi:hypothetical protein
MCKSFPTIEGSDCDYALPFQERQKVQEQLDLIMKSIQCSEEEVQKLQDENNPR